MGASKRLMEQQEQDATIQEKLQLLYEGEYIQDSRCQGITRQILAQGTMGLSHKQKYLYTKMLEPLMSAEIAYCEHCSCSLLKSYAYEVFESESGDKSYWCSRDCYDESLNMF